jgi:hypothetical protein
METELKEMVLFNFIPRIEPGIIDGVVEWLPWT